MEGRERNVYLTYTGIEATPTFEETLRCRYERRNFPLRIQPHFSVAGYKSSRSMVKQNCGDFRAALVETLAQKFDWKKKKERTKDEKNIYVRCVRANKNTNINSNSDTPIKILRKDWKRNIYAFILLDCEFPDLSIPPPSFVLVSVRQLLIVV